MEWYYVLALCAASFGAGVPVGYYAPRYMVPKLAPKTEREQTPGERVREAPLRFQYTLDGHPVLCSNGKPNLIPEGQDPREAAARRSLREGRSYGSTRFTPR